MINKNYLLYFFFLLILLPTNCLAIVLPENPNDTADGPVGNPAQTEAVDFHTKRFGIGEAIIINGLAQRAGVGGPITSGPSDLDNSPRSPDGYAFTDYSDKSQGVLPIIGLESHLSQYAHSFRRKLISSRTGIESYSDKILVNNNLIHKNVLEDMLSGGYVYRFPETFLTEDFLPIVPGAPEIENFSLRDKLYYMPTSLGWIIFKERESPCRSRGSARWEEEAYLCNLEDSSQNPENPHDTCNKIDEELYYIHKVIPLTVSFKAIMELYQYDTTIEEINSLNSILEIQLAVLEMAPFGSLIRTSLEFYHTPSWEKRALVEAKGADVAIDTVLDAVPFIAQFKSGVKASKRLWYVGAAATVAVGFQRTQNDVKGDEYRAVFQLLAFGIVGRDIFTRGGDVAEDLAQASKIKDVSFLQALNEQGANNAPILNSVMANVIQRALSFSTIDAATSVAKFFRLDVATAAKYERLLSASDEAITKIPNLVNSRRYDEAFDELKKFEDIYTDNANTLGARGIVMTNKVFDSSNGATINIFDFPAGARANVSSANLARYDEQVETAKKILNMNSERNITRRLEIEEGYIQKLAEEGQEAADTFLLVKARESTNEIIQAMNFSNMLNGDLGGAPYAGGVILTPNFTVRIAKYVFHDWSEIGRLTEAGQRYQKALFKFQLKGAWEEIHHASHNSTKIANAPGTTTRIVNKIQGKMLLGNNDSINFIAFVTKLCSDSRRLESALAEIRLTNGYEEFFESFTNREVFENIMGNGWSATVAESDIYFSILRNAGKEEADEVLQNGYLIRFFAEWWVTKGKPLPNELENLIP